MVYLDQKYRTLGDLLLKKFVLLEDFENKVPLDNILVPILKCNPRRVTKHHQSSSNILYCFSSPLLNARYVEWVSRKFRAFIWTIT